MGESGGGFGQAASGGAEATGKKKGRASTGSARTGLGGERSPPSSLGDGSLGSDSAAGVGEALGVDAAAVAGELRFHGGRNRVVQVVRYERRKLFNRERKQVFLEWFAATCNMGWAAEKADVSYKTVSKHLLNDPEFRAAVDEAMALGVLRVKAKSLETRRQEEPVQVEGEIDAPELNDMTREQAAMLMREHGRTLVLGRKQGRAPRAASNAEVIAALAKRLVVFGRRVRGANPPE